MKAINKHSKNTLGIICIGLLFLSYSCEKELEEISYDQFSETSFYKTPEDAKLAVTAVYSTLNPDGYSIYGSGANSITVQSSATTDEIVCSWGDPVWIPFYQLNFSEDFPSGALNSNYEKLMPAITNATITIDKLSKMTSIGSELKNRYIGEVKALRAHYSWILYNFYGPVSLRLDAKEAANPNAAPIPRLSKEEMVKQIEKDYNEALISLPAAINQTAGDYGRMTKEVCLMGLVKLYMHEKRWQDVIINGKILQGMGHNLQPSYSSVFTYENNGNKQEVLFAIPTRMDANSSNLWLAHALPGNYSDPNGKSLTQWGGYKIPWKTYDKFDQRDKRLEKLITKWQTEGGSTFDARANKYIGAIPVKYGTDPNATDESMGVNIIIWRYSDVLLSLAEAINEASGPTSEAYELVKQVRNRAGLDGLPSGLSKDQFRSKLMDERLFEFWCEGGIRREDMIRWGTYIQRAKDDGSTFVKPEFVLYPIPRKVINETNGIIKQNTGY
ncbi:RagB/SusD family nutrient uptake outer membrane protein [Elizabethkingia anophelis]|nr:RagB/SusD family nutrient uptake outer membrane protein [Elizabethkingia anophelis]